MKQVQKKQPLPATILDIDTIPLDSHIQFWGHRICKGNPVTGILLSRTNDYFTVRLTKDIEGLTTLWSVGYEKNFHKSQTSQWRAIEPPAEKKPVKKAIKKAKQKK